MYGFKPSGRLKNELNYTGGVSSTDAKLCLLEPIDFLKFGALAHGNS